MLGTSRAGRGDGGVSWIRRGVAWLLLTVIVIAPPVAVLTGAAGGIWRQPTRDDVTGWLDDPLTPGAATAAIVVLVVLGWTALTALVLVMAIRTGSRALVRLRRMPLPSPAQATATSMAGAAALGVPGYAADAMVPSGPPPLATSTAAVADDGSGLSDDAAATAWVGVELPDGGWMPPGTAELVDSVAGLLWLHRRRFYRLADPGTGDRDDTSAPVLPAVAAVQAARPAQRGLVTDQPVIGTDNDSVLPLQSLPAGGLSLAGPGADDAARGLVIPLLLTAGSSPISASVWITRDLFTRLLGDHGDTSADELPGLHLAGSATDLIEARCRATAPAGAGRISALLITDADDKSGSSPQQVDVNMQVPNTIRVVLNGAAPDAWHIRGDGTVHPSAHPADHAEADRRLRLCVLSRQTGIDLLNLARATHIAAVGPAANRHPAQAGHLEPAPTAGASGPGAARLQLNLFGEVRLSYRAQLVTVRRRAALQILAYLAVHHPGATAAQLGTAIWPGQRPHTVAPRVYTTISELRRTLHGLTGRTVVHRSGDTYLLDPDGWDVDLWAHRRAVTAATAAITTTDRPTALRAIIDGAAVQLAAGQVWPWALGVREEVRRDVIDAYAALAELSSPAAAVALLADALSIDPLNEDLHRRTLQALAANADHDAIVPLAVAYRRRVVAAGLPAPVELLELAERLRDLA